MNTNSNNTPANEIKTTPLYYAADIVAQAREAHPEWPAAFFAPDFFEREAKDEHGHRIKTPREIDNQARRIDCNYMAGRGGLRDIARRLERTKGADHPDTVAAYKRLQSRAAWMERARLEAHRTAGEKRRAAYFRELETAAAAYDPNEPQGARAVAGMAAPDGVTLHAFSFANRAPRWATAFRNEGEAAEWLRRAANGTGALDTQHGAEVLKAAPDCLIWYSRRNSGYYCQYIADKEGRPLHGSLEDYRGLLLEFRKRHQLHDIAARIREATDNGRKLVTATADRRARVEVSKEENDLYITAWIVGNETDETRAHLHAIDAAAVVWTFREGYACDLGDIVTTNEPTTAAA